MPPAVKRKGSIIILSTMATMLLTYSIAWAGGEIVKIRDSVLFLPVITKSIKDMKEIQKKQNVKVDNMVKLISEDRIRLDYCEERITKCEERK